MSILRIGYLINWKPMPEEIKQEIKNVCLLKQINVIGLLKVGGSNHIRRSVKILEIIQR